MYKDSHALLQQGPLPYLNLWHAYDTHVEMVPRSRVFDVVHIPRPFCHMDHFKNIMKICFRESFFPLWDHLLF